MREAATMDGRTVLYVSHNMNTIRQLCDRCIVLDKGKVVFEGEVEESINHYMSTTKPLAVVNECPGERKGFNIDRQIHIDTVTFLNTEYPVYEGYGPVRVQVDYTARRDVSNLAFRMTVFSGDKTVVGLSTSKPVIHAREGQNSKVLSLPLDWLAPGKYIVRLTAYSVNEFGGSSMHDVADDCFAFEKTQSMGDNNRMNWNHVWWGYMMFPEMKLDEYE